MNAIPPASAHPSPPTHDARQRLRHATAQLHATVDGLFAGGLDSAAVYRRYVLGMHRFAAEYDVVVGASPGHSSRLAQDLIALALPPLPALGVRHRALDQDVRLGWEYVMAGSSLGARRLVRDARALGFGATRVASFLEHHAAGAAWPALQARLDAFDSRDAQRMSAAETGAREAFALVQDCFARSFEVLPDAPDAAPAASHDKDRREPRH